MLKLKEYLELAEEYNIIPIYQEIIADTETPISLYQKLSGQKEYSYLLESTENDRYSFIGLEPAAIYRNYNDTIEITRNGSTVTKDQDFIEYLQDYLAEIKVYQREELPPFTGGFVGYFNYEMIEKWEDIYHKEPGKELMKGDKPLSLLVETQVIVACDHLNNRVKIINNLKVSESLSLTEKKEIYSQGISEIERVKALIDSPVPDTKNLKANSPAKSPEATGNAGQFNLKSNIEQVEFQEMVKRAKEHIIEGDIFQIVLSQKFSVKNQIPPFNIYRALRSTNPSPYSFYLNFPEIKIIGSSPEVLVRVRDRQVMTRPLAGTRPRGSNKKEDLNLAADLKSDEKERSEHTMLLDLGRNDLSRIAAPGTVEVTELMEVEYFSRVMHLVSQVEAELKPGYDSLDALKANFPAGTVSGAPKIKAVELIDNIEKEARGVYAGTVAYLSFNGNLDSCITIRTFSLEDGILNLQVGAGIVADSDPATEYQETLNKGQALFEALKIATGGGDFDLSNR
ncbi:chorismate-binding protein [Halanaerobiaceae bacterium Z-7014]|uniref:Anthranilate synthase component 1 n=1 Tax=Halonatronomonas betaini TaxID=2778430 RepID=A0A931AWA7_9FIRM|nr:chorismate-binding protein [Halonatronomonas betaini]MBF8437266.1 chorismate-binding protein [Halonatronomonas betaini]